MKYVMLPSDIPIIFPDVIQHLTFFNLHPISAGFVHLYGDDKPLEGACVCSNAIRVSVYGESVSLGLKSRPQDEAIITRELHRHYN